MVPGVRKKTRTGTDLPTKARIFRTEIKNSKEKIYTSAGAKNESYAMYIGCSNELLRYRG